MGLRLIYITHRPSEDMVSSACVKGKKGVVSPLDRNRRDIPMTVDKRLGGGTVPLEVLLRGPWRVRG
jgi:hypothetical protein